MSRPLVNRFGNLMKRVTDPLIKQPVQSAIRDGADDFAKILGNKLDDLTAQIDMGSSSAAAGGVMGGLLGGGIGAAGSLGAVALGEILRQQNREPEQDELVNKLMAELKNNSRRRL